MKVAIATHKHWSQVSGHAGQAREWLLFDCRADAPLPDPQRIALSKEQLPHHFKDDGPHPLHGVQVLIAASAGDGFLRHMNAWGAEVLLTGETDPQAALRKVLAGEALPDTRFDVTTALCKVRDLFSRY